MDFVSPQMPLAVGLNESTVFKKQKEKCIKKMIWLRDTSPN